MGGPGRIKGSMSIDERNKLRERMLGNQLTKGRRHTEEAKEKLRIKHTGKKLSPEHIEKNRIAQLGRKMSVEAIAKTVAANIGRKNSIEIREKMRQAQKIGPDNPNWTGGLWASEHKQQRKSVEYRNWRDIVYTRDQYTCQFLRISGGMIHPHHIFSFAENPNLRFESWNGITLSRYAHLQFHKEYGKSNNTLEQLEEYLGKRVLTAKHYPN